MSKYEKLLCAAIRAMTDDKGHWDGEVFYRQQEKCAAIIRHDLAKALDEIEPNWRKIEVEP